MFKDKNTEISSLQESLDELSEHMNMISDGMFQFQRDIGILSKEINVIKSYIEMIILTLDKSKIIKKQEIEKLVKRSMERKILQIQDNIDIQEEKMKKDKKDIKHLIEKFKSSITNWFDEDGNPIAKA